VTATPQYLVEYNGYTLPGFAQKESFDSTIVTASHDAPYADGALVENMGLANKMLSMEMKVWDESYDACKNQIKKAATILRTRRQGFAKLRIQSTDKYYEAIPKSIKMDKQAGTSPKLVDYSIEFEAKPWYISDTVYTVSGSGLNGASNTITTAGRTLDDGGWTYATLKVSGTNVTISGYTLGGEPAGYITVSGTVRNLTIDSEAFTATISGGLVNMNSYMRSVDYRMSVGPETTYFAVTGAQLCEISYQNRWYI
jgi:phage-related protein